MSWTAQALHIARKDVRYTRVALIVYSVIVVIALIHAVRLPIASPAVLGAMEPASAAMFVLVLLGVILAANAVQADSPIQSNAFWASRPFAPTAIAGAKLIYCAVALLGIPLLAEAIGLVQYDAPAGVIVANLIRSVTMYGLILLCAVVVASLTTDLRGFIVGALVLVVSFVLLATVLWNGPSNMVGIVARAVPLIVAIGGSIGLLVALYRRRDIGRIAWLGAAVVVGATFLVFEAIDSPPGEVPTALRTTQISLDASTDQSIRFASPTAAIDDRKTRLPVRFTLTNLPATARVSLQVDSALLHLRDGSVVKSSRTYGYMAPNNGLGALPPGVRQFGSMDDRHVMGMNLMFNADSATVAAKGMGRVDVWARVLVAEAIPLAATRIGTRLDTTVDGTRLRVFDQLDTDVSTINVVATTVVDPRHASDPRDIGMVVINESAREGIVLTGSGYANSTAWMVLPGAPINTAAIVLNTRMPAIEGDGFIGPLIAGVAPITERLPTRREGRFPDPAWYRNAKIVAVQWAQRGSYPVRLSKTLN